MSFCTAVNCMDGRFQLPVIEYLKSRFAADYVDMITEPGPVRLLYERSDTAAVDSILKRIDISVKKHKSKALALIAHHDCAGNPVPESIQKRQLNQALDFLKGKYPHMEIIALWADEYHRLTQIPSENFT